MQNDDTIDDTIDETIDDTNDEDMLSNMDYENLDPDETIDEVPATTDSDLDMNNILENNELILDGLNMTFLDNGNNTNHVNEEFDVDGF